VENNQMDCLFGVMGISSSGKNLEGQIMNKKKRKIGKGILLVEKYTIMQI
jgi:hypothetical protein